MPNVVYFVSYRLKDGASVPDFLAAAERLSDGYMSKQPGFVSWQQLLDGDLWVDWLTFETMGDAKRVSNPSGPNPLASKFYSFIDLKSCETHLFSIERSY